MFEYYVYIQRQWKPCLNTIDFEDVLKEHFKSERITKLCIHSRSTGNQVWLRSTKIVEPFPKSLMIFLKRNMINPITGLNMKNNDIIKIKSMKFKMPTTNKFYSITGTMAHSGTIRAGHYVSYVPKLNQNSFIKLDDDKFADNQTFTHASTNLCSVFAQLENIDSI